MKQGLNFKQILCSSARGLEYYYSSWTRIVLSAVPIFREFSTNSRPRSFMQVWRNFEICWSFGFGCPVAKILPERCQWATVLQALKMGSCFSPSQPCLSQSSPGHRATTDGCTISTTPGPCWSHIKAGWPPGDEVVSLHDGQIIHGDNARFVGSLMEFSPSHPHGIQGTLGRGVSIKPAPEVCKCAKFACFVLSAFLWAFWMEPGNVFGIPPSLPHCQFCALPGDTFVLSVLDVSPWSLSRHWTCCDHKAPPSPPRAVGKEPLDSYGLLPDLCLQEQLAELMLSCDSLKGAFTAQVMSGRSQIKSQMFKPPELARQHLGPHYWSVIPEQHHP